MDDHGTSGGMIWTLSGSRAVLACKALVAAVDVEQPGLGIHDLLIKETLTPGRLLGITLGDATARAETTWQPNDAFVRGADLVAVYRRVDDDPFAVKVHWRLKDADAGQATIDAIVSIETRSWESYPAVTVMTALAGQCEAASDRPQLAWQMPGGALYVEGARRGDFFGPQCMPVGETLTSSTWKFDHQFMERGVIRRLHLRGRLFLAARNPSVMDDIASQLATESPPLTA